jgi:virulence factor
MGIKIGIFGAGSIARKAYLPLLVSWPDVEIVGVYSRTERTIEEICNIWHIQYGTTELNTLVDRGIQAAFVLTSQSSHFEIAQKLLTEGIDVYIEKPATESSSQTQQLSDLARKHGRIFMVSFNRRYAPLNRQARDLFKQRSVDLCIIEKHRPSAYHTSLFHNYLDDTIHQIDLLCYYCADPQPLHTSFQMKGEKLTCAVSIASLTGGGIGMVLTCLQAGAWQERVMLHGDGLSVEVNAFRELRIKTGDHEEIYGNDRPGRWFPELTERGFSGAIEHFLECVQTRSVPETNGAEAVKSQRFMEKLVAIAKPENTIPNSK